jgi:hypothetical protein
LEAKRIAASEILSEYKVISSTKQLKRVDPLILLDSENDDDDTLTLRLAIAKGFIHVFMSMWELRS